MKNDLFNQSLLKKYSSEFKLYPSKYDLIKDHLLKLEEGQFKSETKNYLYFYDIILHQILGYDREENILFDEKEEEGKGKSEFVLKSPEGKFMVVELKDQITDLDKSQNRKNDKRTPVDQAFDYAQHTGDIEWIMVSNFDEFRLYNWHQKGKYIAFKAEELLDKRMYAYFMTSFSLKAYIKENYPARLMEKTLVVERELEKEFYKLYNETRLMLMRELEEYNNFVRDGAIHYAQLILNRYMFISFAEDTGLLPSQVSTDTIITPIRKGNLRHRSIWQRLNELFLDISEGNDYKKISAYNGGLFEEDLDSIQIRDTVDDLELFEDVWQNWNFEEYEKDIIRLMGANADKVNPIYKNLLTISSFDFSSELDVNILGHIFENSIGDLEELKEDVRGRRKKEGIFYTPEYITDYICRNTIIPYLSKSGKVNTVADLIDEYWGSAIEELDEKVQNIKIVDPACGSGAFLNKAADVLVEIHQAIHEELYKDKKDTLTPYFDQVGKRREILLNNIYGVDLNEESVEITKLSLFLKVCKKDTKLPALDENIKCGNSLIDASEYTDKPFNWEEEFSEIFKEGGFDVVIGNPPYVNIIKIPKKQLPYFKKIYQSASYGRIDLYLLFMEKAINLLKYNGLTSFIIPDKFCTHKYASILRKFILQCCYIEQIIDLRGFKIFEDAVVENIVYVLKKEDETSSGNILAIIKPEDEFIKEGKIKGKKNEINQLIFNKIPEKMFRLDLTSEKWLIIEKIKNLSQNMEKLCYISFGLQPGKLNKFVFNKYKNPERLNENKDVIEKFIRGRNIGRYFIDYTGDIVFYLPKELHRPAFPELFDNNKIVISEISKDLRATYDKEKYYGNEKTVQVIPWYYLIKVEKSVLSGRGIKLDDELIENSKTSDLRYLLAVLNSKLINFFFKVMISDGLNVFPDNIRKLPIYPATTEQQQPLIENADLMLHLNRQLQDEVKGFQDWLQHTFGIEKLSKKLEKYYDLSLDEFLEEVRKKKVDVKARKNYQALKNEFEESLTKVQPLLQEIEKTDAEIGEMVYDLYGLTEEDIRIVEESLNN